MTKLDFFLAYLIATITIEAKVKESVFLRVSAVIVIQLGAIALFTIIVTIALIIIAIIPKVPAAIGVTISNCFYCEWAVSIVP